MSKRAAQRMVSAANGTKSTRYHGAERGGFCGSIQRSPPQMPASLARRMTNKESLGFGRVKVMLRVSDNPPTDGEKSVSYLSIDKKKRQVTLSEPTNAQNVTGQNQSSSNNAAQDRGPMVSAPKMFAFDALHTNDDSQLDVCASALSEVIPAVLDGSDGCLLSIGYPGAGQNRTMLGSVASTSDLGAIPCAISWLYKGINEKRQKSGARFSVRVSALGINATKPGTSAKDLLASLATESDESPGIYLRDDYLGGPTELRAPTAERAALFLDAALAGRTSSIYEPALIFTLHVYQYSLGAGKGGVAGGRSRLHLIDLGGCANRCGGLPLSAVGNVVLSILSGQRHPPNREHPLTPLLKDCLAPLTCHVAIIAHVGHSQTHADALTTIQLASRIHRLRRRKHRFPLSGDKSGSGNTQSGSSSGPDPSSSDFSADTVIYCGPSLDDATDNEHPPVFLPNLNSGDNRCAMNKVLRGSAVEKNAITKSPVKKPNIQKPATQLISSSSHQKSDSLKRNQAKHLNDAAVMQSPTDHTIYAQVVPSGSPIIVAGALKHTSVSKSSNFPTPKSSPMKRNTSATGQEATTSRLVQEQWIDGPKVSKYRVAEARHLMREINHVKNFETWIDGPNSKANPQIVNAIVQSGAAAGYGFMDSHKKKMIRQWVENQTCQILHQIETVSTNPVQYHTYYKAQSQNQQQQIKSDNSVPRNDDDHSSIGSKNDEFVNPLSLGLNLPTTVNANYSESSIKTGLKQQQLTNEYDQDIHSEKSASNISENRQLFTNSAAVGCSADMEEEDQDSGPSEVPPALPLIEPLGSREVSRHVSRESLCQNIMMMDCALQVTEDDIARAMGGEHPLSALSNGDISVVSSFNVGDTFSECIIGDSTRNQMDQLARLRELFNSQLAMAEVIPAFRIDSGSVYSEPAYRFNAGPGSVCSEPVYRAPSPRCRDCRQSISRTPSQTSLPSLNGIVAIAGMEPYASLRHPDGASDPNIKKSLENCDVDDKVEIHIKENPLADLCETDLIDKKNAPILSINNNNNNIIHTKHPLPHLPLLPLSTPEYDSGHDSTPRASKHSGISRRAESGYHSVATVRDSDESSFSSSASRPNNNSNSKNNDSTKNEKSSSSGKKKNRQDKSLCQWLRNPFTCTYPDTEGDVSDF
ncbi:kinesin-like protein CG14535 isoform X4 [Chironomus tepperi]|uniref:kinesin-like protein CG14535 isoform X4 n=1 Tax=Chironomus tepperi TaxID=113505 RepID=UPI00391F1EFB